LNPFGPLAERDYWRDVRAGDDMACSAQGARTLGTFCDVLGLVAVVGSGIALGYGSSLEATGGDGTKPVAIGAGLDLAALVLWGIGALEASSARRSRAAWKERWDGRRARAIAAHVSTQPAAEPGPGGGDDPRPAGPAGEAPPGPGGGREDGDDQPGGGGGTRPPAPPGR
jgi:hypothetical protein